MKKVALLFALGLSLCIQALAKVVITIPDTTFVDLYGGIRAEMTKSACKIAGFDDESTVNLIHNNSLSAFKSELQQKDKKLFNIVNASTKNLRNMSLEQYSQLVENMRLKYKFLLIENYNSKEEDIDNEFRAYKESIESLTIECKCLLESAEKYKTEYPNGRLSFLLTNESVGEENTSSHNEVVPTQNENSHTISSAAIDNKSSQIEDIKGYFSFDMPFFKSILLTIIVLCFLVIIFRTRKYLADLYSKIMNKASDFESQQGNNNRDAESTLSTKRADIHTNMSNTVSITPDSTQILKKVNEYPTPAETINIPGNSIAFAKDSGTWTVIGASVQGNGHISSEMPCQDHSAYEYLGKGWGIAISSDGAGSAKHSDVGSRITVARTMHYLKTIIESEGWIKKNIMPSEVRWTKLAMQGLKLVHNDIQKFAASKGIEASTLNATIIAVIHSPLGLLVAHVGDGRAGYRDFDGQWHSMIIPHKGEEANQTIFIPSNFWDIPFYEMSGVMVPEARVINKPVFAFTLMSDGCENASWLCNQFNRDSSKFYDPNLPHKAFFDPLCKTLLQPKTREKSEKDKANDWYQFIKDGNQKFNNESDDKTMILGVLCN